MLPEYVRVDEGGALGIGALRGKQDRGPSVAAEFAGELGRPVAPRHALPQRRHAQVIEQEEEQVFPDGVGQRGVIQAGGELGEAARRRDRRVFPVACADKRRSKMKLQLQSHEQNHSPLFLFTFFPGSELLGLVHPASIRVHPRLIDLISFNARP